MATRVEIKQGIVSERSGKCVLMWVWGNGVAQIVSFWLSSPGDATNPKQQRAEKSLSQSTRNFAPVAPSLCTEYGFIAAENPLSIQIHHEGNKLSAFCFLASMRTHETAQTLKTSRLRSAGNSPHLLSGLARDCVLSCFKIDIISLADVNISQSPFIRITGKFSWKRLILCSASSWGEAYLSLLKAPEHSSCFWLRFVENINAVSMVTESLLLATASHNVQLSACVSVILSKKQAWCGHTEYVSGKWHNNDIMSGSFHCFIELC